LIGALVERSGQVLIPAQWLRRSGDRPAVVPRIDGKLLLCLRRPCQAPRRFPRPIPASPAGGLDLRDQEPPRPPRLPRPQRLIHTGHGLGDPERVGGGGGGGGPQVATWCRQGVAGAHRLRPGGAGDLLPSTAPAILDRDLNLLPGSAAYGTEYIQTKALCLQQLERPSPR